MQKVRRTLGEDSWFFCRLSIKNTLLPYEVYICPAKHSRGLRKKLPTLYVLVKNKFIAISIGDNPVVLCKRYSNIEQLQDVVDWIKYYKNTLLKHWKGEMDDVETLNILGNYKNIELS